MTSPAQLDDLIARAPALAPHRERLLALARPSVAIRLTKGKPQDAGSRFGGQALVPPDFTWPTSHPIADYYFLGQINFSEIVDPPPGLPREGLLSLFYAMDAAFEVFWQDEGYVRGYYWPSVDGLRLMPQPENEALRNGDIVLANRSRKLQLSTGGDLPRHADLDVDWPADPAEREALQNALEEADLPEDYLLGYPSFDSLAYDPTPGPEWMPLLTVRSHEDLEWCWHDGDKLMVFIERDKLAVRDFSHLKADAG